MGNYIPTLDNALLAFERLDLNVKRLFIDYAQKNVALIERNDKLRKAMLAAAQPPEIVDPLDELADEMEVSVRVANCLKYANCRTLRDVISMSAAELRRLPNFGLHSLADLREELQRRGLYLREDITPKTIERLINAD
jgi:DNA-directed RNA polymerase alpha subunit